MLLKNKYHNAEAVAIALMHELDKGVTSDEVKAELYKHPRFPQLQSFCDLLANFHFKAKVATVSTGQIAHLSFPAVVQTQEGLVLALKTEKNDIFIKNENGIKKMPLREFLPFCDGTVLTTTSAFLNKPVNKRKFVATDKWFNYIAIAGLVILILSGATSALIFNLVSLPVLLIAFFKTIGLVVSVLLLVQSIDGNSDLIQKICSKGKKTDCTSILNSKAAKITSWLSWSEVGFFYFAGTWLAVLFDSGSMGTLQTLMLINIPCLLFSFYSIYYQAKVAKTWCILCCTIQAMFWLEFLGFLLLLPGNPFRPEIGISLIIRLIIPVFLWILIKNVLVRLNEAEAIKLQLHFTKFNTDAFKQFLHQQPAYPTPDAGYSIVMGNPAPETIITMVSNPYCSSCVIAHQQLSDLLSYNWNLQARIIFIPDEEGQLQITPISSHLMALYKQGGEKLVKNALHDWYSQPEHDVKTWQEKYPADVNRNTEQIIAKQKTWCVDHHISHTPTILINGSLMPDFYQLSELKYLLNRHIS